MTSYKLKSQTEKVASQYFLMNSRRIDTASKITFESIACAYSKLNFDLKLTAYTKDKNGIMTKKDSLLIPRKHSDEVVAIIPLGWFTDEVEVRLTHFDASTIEEQKQSGNIIFSNIKK